MSWRCLAQSEHGIARPRTWHALSAFRQCGPNPNRTMPRSGRLLLSTRLLARSDDDQRRDKLLWRLLKTPPQPRPSGSARKRSLLDLAPNERAICTRRRPSDRADGPRGADTTIGAPPGRISGAKLALGALLSELVTSAGWCGCAHIMDHAEWSDLAIHCGLRRRRLGDWVRPRVSQGDRGRHEQHQSQRRAVD
jgi:hypothetical protein